MILAQPILSFLILLLIINRWLQFPITEGLLRIARTLEENWRIQFLQDLSIVHSFGMKELGMWKLEDFFSFTYDFRNWYPQCYRWPRHIGSRGSGIFAKGLQPLAASDLVQRWLVLVLRAWSVEERRAVEFVSQFFLDYQPSLSLKPVMHYMFSNKRETHIKVNLFGLIFH